MNDSQTLFSFIAINVVIIPILLSQLNFRRLRKNGVFLFRNFVRTVHNTLLNQHRTNRRTYRTVSGFRYYDKYRINHSTRNIDEN